MVNELMEEYQYSYLDAVLVLKDKLCRHKSNRWNV